MKIFYILLLYIMFRFEFPDIEAGFHKNIMQNFGKRCSTRNCKIR